MGLAVEGPDVNCSQFMFAVEGASIRYGLGAIKGVGQAAVGMHACGAGLGGAFGRSARSVPSHRPEPRQPPRARGTRCARERSMRSRANRATLMHDAAWPPCRRPTSPRRRRRRARSDLFGVATHAPDAGAPTAARRTMPQRRMERCVPVSLPSADARPVPDGSSDCRGTNASCKAVISGRMPTWWSTAGTAGEGGWRNAGPQRHGRRVWCSRSASVAEEPASSSTTAAAASSATTLRGRLAAISCADRARRILVRRWHLRWDEFIEDLATDGEADLDLDQATRAVRTAPRAALARQSQRRCRRGRYRARAGAATEPWRPLRGRYPLQPRRRQPRLSSWGRNGRYATSRELIERLRAHPRTGRVEFTTRLGSTAESTGAAGIARPRRSGILRGHAA